MYFVLSRIHIFADAGSEDTPATVAYDIPLEVVREAVVNAVVHRDYAAGGRVQVRLFPDRLEVRNPGTLPPGLTPAGLRKAHVSVPGNPLLAEPLYLTTYRERRGFGTCDMIERCRKSGLPEPEFRLADGFVVILRRGADGVGRTYIEAAILDALADAGVGLTIAEIAARIGKDKNNIRRALNALVAGGKVLKVAAFPTDPDTRYKLAQYA